MDKAMDRHPGGDVLVTGLKVLLVDHDLEYLEILGNTLGMVYKHEVTVSTGSEDAMAKLMEGKDAFDIVLAEYADTNGLQILDLMQKSKADLPLIVLFSNNPDIQVVKQSIERGACFFLQKPISDDMLKIVWQYVFRLRLNKDVRVGGALEVYHQPEKFTDSKICQPLCDHNSISNHSEGSSGMKGDPSGADDHHDYESNGSKCSNETATPKPNSKKRRFQWTDEINQIFVEAFEQIDKMKRRTRNDDKVYPKEILDKMCEMGVSGLTRHIVSSHLQKYRALKKKQSVPSPPRPCPSYMTYHYQSASCAAPIQHQCPPYVITDDRLQQCNAYYQNHQQVGPHHIGPMNQQQTLQPSHISQQNFGNLVPYNNAMSLTAPMNPQFGTSSVFGNQYQPLIPCPQPIQQSALVTPGINPSNQFGSAPASDLNEDVGLQPTFDDLPDLTYFQNLNGETN